MAALGRATQLPPQWSTSSAEERTIELMGDRPHEAAVESQTWTTEQRDRDRDTEEEKEGCLKGMEGWKDSDRGKGKEWGWVGGRTGRKGTREGREGRGCKKRVVL